MDVVLFILKILPGFIIAGFIDFWFKERRKKKILDSGGSYNDMPPLFEHTWHPPGWHLKISSIWIIIMIIEVVWFNWGYEMFLQPIIFYTEDWFYYIFRYIWYGGYGEKKTILPDELPWLHADIPWYKAIVGERFPVENFNVVYILSWGILIVAYSLVV